MTEMIQLETHPSVILKIRTDVADQCRVCSKCRGTGEYLVSLCSPYRIPFGLYVWEVFPCPSCRGRGHFWSVCEADDG